MWSVRIPRRRPRPVAARMTERFGLDEIRRLSTERALRHRAPPSAYWLERPLVASLAWTRATTRLHLGYAWSLRRLIFALVNRGRLPRVH